MGRNGLKELLTERTKVWLYMKTCLEKLAADYEMELIQTPQD